MKRLREHAGILALLLVVCCMTMAVDPWTTFRPTPTSTARDMFNPTLSDTVDEAVVCKAFYSEVAGTIKVTTAAGTDMEFTVAAFQDIKLQIKRFWSSTTTPANTAINCYKD